MIREDRTELEKSLFDCTNNWIDDRSKILLAQMSVDYLQSNSQQNPVLTDYDQKLQDIMKKFSHDIDSTPNSKIKIIEEFARTIKNLEGQIEEEEKKLKDMEVVRNAQEIQNQKKHKELVSTRERKKKLQEDLDKKKESKIKDLEKRVKNKSEELSKLKLDTAHWEPMIERHMDESTANVHPNQKNFVGLQLPKGELQIPKKSHSQKLDIKGANFFPHIPRAKNNEYWSEAVQSASLSRGPVQQLIINAAEYGGSKDTNQRKKHDPSTNTPPQEIKNEWMNNCSPYQKSYPASQTLSQREKMNLTMNCTPFKINLQIPPPPRSKKEEKRSTSQFESMSPPPIETSSYPNSRNLQPSTRESKSIRIRSPRDIQAHPLSPHYRTVPRTSTSSPDKYYIPNETPIQQPPYHQIHNINEYNHSQPYDSNQTLPQYNQQPIDYYNQSSHHISNQNGTIDYYNQSARHISNQSNTIDYHNQSPRNLLNQQHFSQKNHFKNSPKNQPLETGRGVSRIYDQKPSSYLLGFIGSIFNIGCNRRKKI